MELRTLKTSKEIEAVYPVIRELRQELSLGEYMSAIQLAQAANNYTLVGMFNDNICLALIGFRWLTDLAHGKHLYVDDLVVVRSHRSQGLGATLLRFAEQEALRTNCRGLRLCTGVDNEGGKRFYERNGWLQRSVAYKKKLKPEQPALTEL